MTPTISFQMPCHFESEKRDLLKTVADAEQKIQTHLDKKIKKILDVKRAVLNLQQEPLKLSWVQRLICFFTSGGTDKLQRAYETVFKQEKQQIVQELEGQLAVEHNKASEALLRLNGMNSSYSNRLQEGKERFEANRADLAQRDVISAQLASNEEAESRRVLASMTKITELQDLLRNIRGRKELAVAALNSAEETLAFSQSDLEEKRKGLEQAERVFHDKRDGWEGWKDLHGKEVSEEQREGFRREKLLGAQELYRQAESRLQEADFLVNKNRSECQSLETLFRNTRLNLDSMDKSIPYFMEARRTAIVRKNSYPQEVALKELEQLRINADFRDAMVALHQSIASMPLIVEADLAQANEEAARRQKWRRLSM